MWLLFIFVRSFVIRNYFSAHVSFLFISSLSYLFNRKRVLYRFQRLHKLFVSFLLSKSRDPKFRHYLQANPILLLFLALSLLHTHSSFQSLSALTAFLNQKPFYIIERAFITRALLLCVKMGGWGYSLNVKHQFLITLIKVLVKYKLYSLSAYRPNLDVHVTVI